MDLSKIREQREKGAPKESEKKVFKWPDDYYRVTDGEERRELLERGIKENLEPEADQVRKLLWERRYGTKKGVDQLLAAWMNLLFFADVIQTDGKARWHKREKRGIFTSLCLDIMEEKGEIAREMMYLEIYHMLDFYMDLCKKDKKYSGLILGMGTMSQDRLYMKIAQEMYRVAYCVPPVIRNEKGYEVLQQAAVDCFCAKFPDYEKTLLYMIEHEGEIPKDQN